MKKIDPEAVFPPVSALSAGKNQEWELNDLWPMTGLPREQWVKTSGAVPDVPAFAGKIEKQPGYMHDEHYVITRNADAPDRRTVIVCRDSFGFWLLPFISCRFAEVHYFWDEDLSPLFLEKIKPDIVIMERVARVYSRFKGPRIR